MQSSKAFWHEVLNIKLGLFKKNVKRNNELVVFYIATTNTELV